MSSWALKETFLGREALLLITRVEAQARWWRRDQEQEKISTWRIWRTYDKGQNKEDKESSSIKLSILIEYKPNFQGEKAKMVNFIMTQMEEN